MARARSKAWIAATQQMPSTVHHRPHGDAAARRSRPASSPARPRRSSRARAGCRSRDDDGVVVAGFSASGRDGRPVRGLSGADRRKLIAAGQAGQLRGPARLLRARPPLRGPARRRRAALARRVRGAAGRGGPRLRRPAAAPHQPEHEWALALADRAMAEARARGLADRGRDRRPPRRPDPAGLHGRRARPRGRSSPRRSRRPRRRSSCRASEVPDGARGGRPPVPRRAPSRRPAGRRGRARRRPGSASRGADPGRSATRSPRRCSREGLRRRLRRDRRPVRRAASPPTPRCGPTTSPRAHVAAINRDGLRVDGRASVARRRPAPTRGEIPPLRARHRRHQGDAHRGGDRRHRARVRRRRRVQRAERDRQRGGRSPATCRG